MAKRIRIIPWLDRNELDKQLNKIGKEKRKINIDVNGDGADDMVHKLHAMNSTGAKSTSIFGKMKNAITDTFSSGRLATTGYIAVLRGIDTAADKAKDSIESLNKAETDLMIATDMSRESVRGLMKDYNSYAKELASTTGNISDAANDYLRAGKTLEESQALIKDSIMLSKLGDIESATATEDLLATMNGYEMSIEEVDRALDAMVAIDMKAATSAGDLSTGLKYSASSAHSAGLSFNKLIAILGTVQDKTQLSSQVVGTFANQMLSRYRDITIGKYLTDDGEDISNYESVLKSCGLELRDSQGEFRAFEDVLEEMTGKWDSLTSVQQNALIKVAAGTRQQNRFIALMEGYNKVLELTEVAATSAGTAVDKFNSAYMTSLEAKESTLQASFESMIYNSDLEEVYEDILDATTALVNFINQTNALKGVMTGLAVSGGIKAFLTIKTGIHDANINLNQFQNALNMVKQTNISSADFDRLLLLTNNLSESQMRLIMSTNALSISQKEDLLVARGLSREEAKLKLQTYGVTQAQTGLTASTTSAKTAMQGFISVLKANPLFVITTAISAVSMAVSTYKNHLEEVRQATEESANAYKESASSINDYVSRYQDLQKALQDAKGNEEQTASVKQQLLDLQTELNSKFGEEAKAINLVTGEYEKQIEAIRALNKEEANKFLNENRKGISTATVKMEKEQDYVLSAPTLSVDTPDGKVLQEIVDSYTDEGMRLISDDATGAVQIVLKADAQTAYETLNNFETDLRNRAKELGNENLFDDILDFSTNAINNAKSVVDKYGEIYNQAQMANLVTDENASSVYEKALSAVEEYNNAVIASEDPFNDENVAKAKANVESVMAEAEGLGKYGTIFEDVFDQVDRRLLDFNEKLKSDTSLQEWAEQLRGKEIVDLKSMVNDGQDDVFDKLVESAKEYGLEVEEVIDELVRLGYVQGNVQSSTSSELFSSFDNTNLGERLQHANKLFQEGELTHKQYFDSLQNEIDNFDASNFTDSLEDANKASQQFFTDSVQQSASGLSDLINKFDAGEMSVSEYLDGYLAIGETLDSLTDNLQENSAEWNKNGEAISDSVNTALDETQSKMRNAMNVITELQDSTYALEQIMSGSVEQSSDDFRAYTNLIAADLAGIVSDGGQMANEISSYMGTSTEEITNALLTDTSNFSIAEQAIAQNTNTAIQSMADLISTLLDNLGNAISNFKVDISFGVKSIDWSSVNILGKDLNLPKINFGIEANGESLSAIGDAVSSFGKSISTNLAQQFVQQEDYHRGTKVGNSKYKPNTSVLDSYNKALDGVKDSSSSAKKEFNETVDFFERRSKVLENSLSLIEKGMENVVGAFAKNQLVDAQLGIVDEEINNYTDALAMYQEKASSALSRLDSDLQNKIVNGEVSLIDFNNEEVVEAMKDYEGWADKVQECKEKLQELRTQIRQLELEKFNNIVEDYTNQFDIYGDSIDLIKGQIGLLEEAGELIGDSYYTKQIEQSEKQLATLEAQKSAMIEQMTDAISSGRIQKGTDEWIEMQSELANVEKSILDCKTSIEEFNNSLLEIQWTVFERIQTEFGNLHSEMENFVGLFDDFNEIKVSDGKGTWTKEAIATLGLYAQQYELALYQVSQYSDAIEKLTEDYKSGKYSATEYMDKMADLQSGMWDAVNSAESLEDAIIDLNQTRIDEEIETIEDEIDAYEELIDSKLKALDAEKDLHDYRKSIAEQSKSISDLEKQRAALENDNSQVATAKKKLLDAQIADEKSKLEEMEYKHSIEEFQKSLEQQLQDYTDARNAEIEQLRLSLENRELLISQSFENVKANASLVGEQIALIAQEHGIVASNAIISPWTQGENAIASYGEVLSVQSSAFIGNIMGVENEVYNLQNEANVASVALSNMFATRADNLVGQLQASWYAEDNLNYATGILQSSLINTLERGYNIGGITSALGGIQSGLNGVADAANRAAQAIQNALGAQERRTSIEFGGGNGNKAYRVKDIYSGEVLGSFTDYNTAYDFWKKNKASSQIAMYAKGGVIKKDNNPLTPIANYLGEDTVIVGKEGERVLTQKQNDLFETMVKNLEQNGNSLQWNIPNLVVPNNIPLLEKVNRPNVTINYDSMLHVDNFTDAPHLIGAIESTSKKVTTKILNDINRDFRIHNR